MSGIVLPALVVLEGARRIGQRAAPVAIGVGAGVVVAVTGLVFLAIIVNGLSGID